MFALEVLLSRQAEKFLDKLNDKFDSEDILTIEQEAKMEKGFKQIAQGNYITANDYMIKRGLKEETQ